MRSCMALAAALDVSLDAIGTAIAADEDDQHRK